MNKPLTCPVCLTTYNYCRGSICPDCRVKLRAAPNLPVDSYIVAALVASKRYTLAEARRFVMKLRSKGE